MHESHINGHCARSGGPASGLLHSRASFVSQSSGSGFPLQSGVVVDVVVVIVVVAVVVVVPVVIVNVVVVVLVVAVAVVDVTVVGQELHSTGHASETRPPRSLSSHSASVNVKQGCGSGNPSQTLVVVVVDSVEVVVVAVPVVVDPVVVVVVGMQASQRTGQFVRRSGPVTSCVHNLAACVLHKNGSGRPLQFRVVVLVSVAVVSVADVRVTVVSVAVVVLVVQESQRMGHLFCRVTPYTPELQRSAGISAQSSGSISPLQDGVVVVVVVVLVVAVALVVVVVAVVDVAVVVEVPVAVVVVVAVNEVSVADVVVAVVVVDVVSTHVLHSIGQVERSSSPTMEFSQRLGSSSSSRQAGGSGRPLHRPAEPTKVVASASVIKTKRSESAVKFVPTIDVAKSPTMSELTAGLNTTRNLTEVLPSFLITVVMLSCGVTL